MGSKASTPAFAALLALAVAAAAANPAHGAASKTTLLRFSGTQSRSTVVKGVSRSDSGAYSSLHVLASDGKGPWKGGIYSAAKTLKASENGAETPLDKIPPPRPQAAEAEYSPLAGHPGDDATPLERALAMGAARELVFLPALKFKDREKASVEFKTNYGTFKAEYEVGGFEDVLKKKCKVVKRTVSVVSLAKGVSLAVEAWEEEIAFETKIGLPLRRKLRYVVTAPEQRIEVHFEAVAAEVTALAASSAKKPQEDWARALALDKAIDAGNPEEIRKAVGAVPADGDYGALAGYAGYLLKLVEERSKVSKGLCRQNMPESGTYYCTYVPDDYDPGKEYALVLALHGSGGTPEPMAQVWKPFADEKGAIIVAPKSTGGTWTTDIDMKVIRKALNEVSRACKIAQDRKVIFGFSAGAAMAYVAHFYIEEHSFKALVAACGSMQMAQLTPKISAKINDFLPRIKDRHFYLLTGDKDFARGGVVADKAFLEKNGALVQFTEVPGMGHTFAESLMPPIREWLAAALEGKK